MYHPTKVAQRIRSEIIDTLHFEPVYRSVEEVEAFDEHLRTSNKFILDDSGRPAACRDLDPWEIQWQLNERALVMCDAAYAISRYGWIINEEAVISRYRHRVAQEILFEIIADLESKDLAIEIMVLKARQLGITTLIELLIMLRAVFSYGVNSVIASADRKKSVLMAKKLLFAYDMLPCWMKPQFTSRVESEQGAKLEFAQLNSGVSVQHGSQMSGIARGSTATIYHLSECASFLRPQEQIDDSLFKAVHPSPSVFGILESSGEGDVGWWPDKWRYSKSNWPTCRLFPLFLPWFCGIDIWPMTADIRKQPVPPGWYERRLPDTCEHVAKAELYVQMHPLLKKYLCRPHPRLEEKSEWWVDGTMPIEQQYFWELGHEESKSTQGGESKWFQEMAGSDMESLQRSSESVFGYEVQNRINAQRRKTYDVYGFSGQSIEDDFEPPTEDIDYTKERVHVKFLSPKGITYRWELVPLKHDADFIEDLKTSKPDAFWEYGNLCKLCVFHPPRLGVNYSIGIDTSEGGGDDSTVISVTELAPREGMPDVQAAEFRSAYVSHAEAYAFAMCVAAYYGQFAESVREFPLVGVEVVASAGDTCQLQMRKMGYTRFFMFTRTDSKKIQPAKSNKMGWFTYGWSRPILMGNFILSVKNEWYELNSPWTAFEVEHFEAHVTSTGKVKEEHEDGMHDDGIFAAAISIQIARGLQSMTERSKKRFMGDLSAANLPPIDVSPWRGRTLSTNANANPTVDIMDVIL